jgi:hypothetical protein
MAVYRFRVSFEDNEDIYREIEIKSTQNFEDFHNVIVQAIDFDNMHDASFFISDDYWRKGDEITLRPIKENDAKKQSSDVVKRQMNKCKMASLIDDPHQKFVYIYDPKTAWSFMIELLKILPDDVKVSYPKCVKTVGLAPKQHKTNNMAPVVMDDEDFDEEEPHTDEEAYSNAHNDDEIAVLEGEEGEEEHGEEMQEEEHAEDGEEFEDHTEVSFDED